MNEINHKEIGQRIRKQRTFLNMSRDELARKIGITPTFLADIELGTKGFSLKSLNRFCNVLKMSSVPKNIKVSNIQSFWSFWNAARLKRPSLLRKF